MTGNQYVINTFSYIWQRGIEDCVRHLGGKGYGQLEVLLTAPHLWPADIDAEARRRLVRIAETAGTRFVSLNPGGFDNNLVSPAQDVRAFTHGYLEKVIDLAGDLGAKYIVMSPGVTRPLLPPPRQWLMDWFRAGMELLAAHAAKRDVVLMVENIPYAFLPRADDLMTAIDGLPDEHVGIVYDAANAVFVREDPMKGLERVAPRLKMVHLSDTPLDTWRHDSVGRGVVPFEQFGVAVRKLPFAGPVCLEIICDNPDEEIANSITALGKLGWR
jgi:sugar phosphate isomerase/epimerase